MKEALLDFQGWKEDIISNLPKFLGVFGVLLVGVAFSETFVQFLQFLGSALFLLVFVGVSRMVSDPDAPVSRPVKTTVVIRRRFTPFGMDRVKVYRNGELVRDTRVSRS